MKALNILNQYLPNLNVKENKIFLKGLPVFIKNKYKFSGIIISQMPYLLVEVKDKDFGPRELKKHMKIISDTTKLQIIWYFKELHFNKVQRMIKNGENFIIENKQLHLPMIGTSIKNQGDKKVISEKLNGLAENILIREILESDLSGMNKRDIAKEFNVTEVTMGRSISRLLANDLCYEEKNNTSKLVYFFQKDELWEFFRKRIESPIKDYVFLNQRTDDLPGSGVSALSKLTMLADDELPTYAISKKEFKKYHNKEEAVFKENAKAKVELWNREPILTKNGVINPLDIYLIHKDDEDERVQIELEKLLKENGFKIGKSND